MLRRLGGLAFSILVMLNYPLQAQSNSPASRPKKFVTDVSHLAGGAAHVLTSPLRWHGKDWGIFGSVLAGTVVLSVSDEPANDLLRRNHSRTADRLKDLGIEFGAPQTAILFTGSLYVIGWAADSDWLRESCVIMSASLLSSGIIQSSTKYIVGRARPYVGRGHDVFDPFRGEESHFAFFSGHTMVAMIISHTLAKRLDPVPAKVVLYGLGTIGGLARMYNQDHWLTDVVVGNVLAITSVNSVAKWLAAKKNGKAMGELERHWQISPRGRGVNLSVTW